MEPVKNCPWWKRGIIYEVYMRSFSDSSGDGVGDLRGLCERLDYFKWLGVDAVWVTPFYPSPMDDFGYDVADYSAVHLLFGNMGDFDTLIREAHKRDIKIIVDIVPNHSSDQHPWFQESKSSRDSPKRDWYIWKDPAQDGGPPNNWLSAASGCAWELDETTGQYFYHAFLPQQPDLNWRNPQVRDAFFDIMRFWLDRGVDGFRVDVMWHLIKDDQFRDNPENPDYDPETMPSNNQQIPIYNTDRPEVHEIVTAMRNLVDSYPGDRLLIGEVYVPLKKLVEYYNPGEGGAHMPHNFQLVNMPWESEQVGDAIEQLEDALPDSEWPNWVLGNHDKSRVATRLGGAAQARVAMMLLLTVRGTPTMYYGDEIGMSDVEIPKDRVQDPFEKRGLGKGQGRDPQRTPMQWDDTPGAGFTTGEPWLPVGDDREVINVEAQRDDPDSMLTLTRRLIELRRAEPALTLGSYVSIHGEKQVVAFRREHEGRRFATVLNFTSEPVEFHLPDGNERMKIVISTLPEFSEEEITGVVRLRPDEGVVLQVQ